MRAAHAARRGEAAFDRWSWVHLGSGLALGVLFSGWLVPLSLLVAFEAAEGVLRRIPFKAGGLSEYESWPNILADLFVGMVGALAVHAWSTQALWF